MHELLRDITLKYSFNIFRRNIHLHQLKLHALVPNIPIAVNLNNVTEILQRNIHPKYSQFTSASQLHVKTNALT